MTQHALGVDFGRVINDGSSHPSGDDTSFLTGSEETMLATPAMEGGLWIPQAADGTLPWPGLDRVEGRPSYSGEHGTLVGTPRLLHHNVDPA